jgi:hypothetical protein
MVGGNIMKPTQCTHTHGGLSNSTRVNWSITDRLPITEHLFIFSSYVLHFEQLKILWERSLKL